MEMKSLIRPQMNLTSNRFLRILAISFTICILLYFITSLSLLWTNSNFRNFLVSSSHFSQPLSLDHIVFGLASSKTSWMKQKEFVKIWWKPESMRGCIFLDNIPPEMNNTRDILALPPICVSQDTSRFRYTYKHGYRSFIRVARIVSETVSLNQSDVRWYVFGDGHTVFIPENLVKTLSKYDHELWYYIGSNSEIYEQNTGNSFEMAFWGGGFAVSAPLAKALAKVFDSCLERYPHLYGSDGRIYACLAELGVGLTRERGFHPVDVRGNIFGLLAAHPITPLVSLSHLNEVDPIFPNMSATNALHHLFKSVTADPERILQQTVCYDRWFSWTISVSWGYAVEVFNQHIHLSDAIRIQDTFTPWKKGAAANYLYSTRPLHPDPCRRSTIFFLNEVHSERTKSMTKYRRILPENCTFDPMKSPKKLQEIVVLSRKSNLSINQLRAPRRQCCEVLPPTTVSRLELSIRECRDDELIRIHV
ncbi:uncharacterized protein LOC110700189 [Chenopodium quinoa]|uniref:Uncharacterized protein n=1 Tax=Chenopodium quinoa TaxID=63459 RepID=A0A803MVZ5_CHEQI|nr:uncharacterized protein LOC110700189 [Chenopodium quinoa]